MIPRGFDADNDQDGRDAAAARAGDEQAFRRLLCRYESALAAHLLRFTNDEASIEDLRQETYLEVYKSLARYRHSGTFSNWLRRIASRVGYRYWEAQAREARAKTAYIELHRRRLPLPESFRDTREVLDRLERNDYTLIEMRFFSGLNATEIGRAMGWNSVRVRVRLHRVLRKLRRLHGALK